MTKKFKVRTAAVFNGQPPGSIIELDEKKAKKYEALKYLEIIEEVKPKPKAKAKPKKKAPAKKTMAKKETKKTETKKKK